MKLEDVYIISNSPYLDEGVNIINSIRTGVDFKEFVAFLPLEHYSNELFKYQSHIRPVNVDYTYDVGCQIHCARIHKEKCTDQLPDEFEISTYGDKSLSKYFSEQLHKEHYTMADLVRLYYADDIDIHTTFIVSREEFLKEHDIQINNNFLHRWNVEESIKTDITKKIKLLDELCMDPDKTFISFNTASEKHNFVKFVHSDVGFKFMRKLFTAVGDNIYYRLDHIFPKVDWRRAWTLEEILTKYNYTKEEIAQLISEL